MKSVGFLLLLSAVLCGRSVGAPADRNGERAGLLQPEEKEDVAISKNVDWEINGRAISEAREDFCKKGYLVPAVLGSGSVCLYAGTLAGPAPAIGVSYLFMMGKWKKAPQERIGRLENEGRDKEYIERYSQEYRREVRRILTRNSTYGGLIGWEISWIVLIITFLSVYFQM